MSAQEAGSIPVRSTLETIMTKPKKPVDPTHGLCDVCTVPGCLISNHTGEFLNGTETIRLAQAVLTKRADGEAADLLARAILAFHVPLYAMTVKLSAGGKRALKQNGSAEHVKEFRSCHGQVIGFTDYINRLGPELDVRWAPSNLRYVYPSAYLIKVRK